MLLNTPMLILLNESRLGKELEVFRSYSLSFKMCLVEKPSFNLCYSVILIVILTLRGANWGSVCAKTLSCITF